MRRVLNILNLLAGLFLILLGGQYLLSLYRLIEITPPSWIGLDMSAASSQVVAWTMVILGCVMMIVSIDYLRIKNKL